MRDSRTRLIWGSSAVALAVWGGAVLFAIGVALDAGEAFINFVLLIAPALLLAGHALIGSAAKRRATRLAVILGAVAALAHLSIVQTEMAHPRGESAWGEVLLLLFVIWPSILLTSIVSVVLSWREARIGFEDQNRYGECRYNLTSLRDPAHPEDGTPFDPNLLQQDEPSGGAASPPPQNTDQ